MTNIRKRATRTLCSGLRGYVLKDNALEELIECIETVSAGKMFLSQDVTAVAVCSIAIAFALLKVIQHFVPVKVSKEEELSGLDNLLHEAA